MGRNFGISSAESGYTAGHDNAPLTINMGSGTDVPIIDFFMDGRRDHYGTNKTLEAGSGHMKALHPQALPQQPAERRRSAVHRLHPE